MRHLVCAALTCAGLLSAQRPDIVLVMADDMGFSDIGCYGGEIATPNLDRLARGGLRFTQFYNTARCCPTRASLMTGLYPHQAGVGHMMSDRGHDGYRGDLNDRCATIAEVLAANGYGTYMSGKWHVTRHTQKNGPKHNWPRQRGFDRFFGTITGAGSFFTPSTLTFDNDAFEPGEDFYYTDAISDHAAGFVAKHQKASPKKPLFLYVAYTAPHWPLHARDEDIAKYRDKYQKGWDVLRDERTERMHKSGIIDGRWKQSARDAKAPDWHVLDEKRRDDLDLRMAVYAAQIDSMDRGIGRIVAALEKAGRLQNTLFLFLADNGGCAEGGRFGFERKKGGRIGSDSSFASYGLAWANASNTPFRRYKHWVHEGGIASPLIVHWPEGLAARGELRRRPGHVVDIMPTCLEAAGVAYPEKLGERELTKLEGESMMPALAANDVTRGPIYWEHEGNRAVRVGRWKLVAAGARGPWELYDLIADRTETNDLAGQQPDKVHELAAMWRAWAKRANVLPLNPRPPERGFGKARHFKLTAGDELSRKKAPWVTGKVVRVKADIVHDGKDGVIVAQGGGSDGWSLFVRDGKPCFATRHRGRLKSLELPDRLQLGRQSLLARIGKKGLALSVETEAGTDLSSSFDGPGPLVKMPIDGLQVGRDEKGAVGRYEPPFRYRGKIERVVIRLEDK